MDPTPVVLDNRAAIDAYAAGFGRSADQLAREIRQVIKGAGLPQGWVAMAGVINVGCDVPEGVSVDTASGVALAPVGLPKGTVECLVAHTSVGVVGVAPEVG